MTPGKGLFRPETLLGSQLSLAANIVAPPISTGRPWIMSVGGPTSGGVTEKVNCCIRMVRQVCSRTIFMKILNLHVEGFRSLKSVEWAPGDLNILIGPNGSGKSNLLRVLELLTESARIELFRWHPICRRDQATSLGRSKPMRSNLG